MNLFKSLMAAAAVAALGGTTPAADGKTFLLTVAVGDTPKLPGFRPLRHADKAATNLYFALLEMVPKADRDAVHLTPSMGESNRPTADNVRKVLKRFAATATDKDRVIVAFVGHGFQTGDTSALVLADSDPADPKSYLAVREIVGRVRAMRCREGAIFIDACRDFRDDVKVTEETDYLPAKPAAVADDLDRKERKSGRVSRERKVYVVQSCGEGQSAFEEEGKGGLLTESLTLALGKERKPEDGTADGDGDGKVTIHEAVDYARKRVRDHARNRHRAVQTLTDEPADEPFELADVGKPAAGAVAAARRDPQPPALSYRSETIPGGPPATPVTPQYVAVGNGFGGNGAFYQERPILNAMVGQGIPHNSVPGVVLDTFRQFAPPDWNRHLPVSGVPVLQQLPGLIRR